MQSDCARNGDCGCSAWTATATATAMLESATTMTTKSATNAGRLCEARTVRTATASLGIATATATATCFAGTVDGAAAEPQRPTSTNHHGSPRPAGDLGREMLLVLGCPFDCECHPCSRCRPCPRTWRLLVPVVILWRLEDAHEFLEFLSCTGVLGA
jgi:hypothetical protein